jgi:hypothetical protein
MKREDLKFLSAELEKANAFRFHEDSETLGKEKLITKPVDKYCISPQNVRLLHSSEFRRKTEFEKSEMWTTRQFPTGRSAAEEIAPVSPALSTETPN